MSGPSNNWGDLTAPTVTRPLAAALEVGMAFTAATSLALQTSVCLLFLSALILAQLTLVYKLKKRGSDCFGWSLSSVKCPYMADFSYQALS